MPNCIACSKPIDGAHLRMTWEGFTTSKRLNGTSMSVHFACVRFANPFLAAPMPERIQDPDPMVHVEPEYESGQWTATCQVHGVVAQKDIRDDAHLGAARHLVRKHSEEGSRV